MQHAMERVLAGTDLDRQLERERQCVEGGISKYRRMVNGAIERGDGGGLGPSKNLITHWVEPFAAGIQAYMDDRSVDETPTEAVWRPVIEDFRGEYDRLAIVVIRTILDRLLADDNYMYCTLCQTIGKAVVSEIRAKAMIEQQKEASRLRKARIAEWREEHGGELGEFDFDRPDEFKVMDELVRKFARVTPKRVNWWAKKFINDRYKSDQMIDRGCGHVGAHLFWVLKGCASADRYDKKFVPSFEIRKIGPRKRKIVQLTAPILRVIATVHSAREIMRPDRLSMLTPPVPWVGSIPGGYLSIVTSQVKNITRAHSKAFARANLKDFNDRVSALSRPAWSIDSRILATQRSMFERGGGIADIPHKDDIPRPERPGTFNPSADKGHRWDSCTEDERDAFRTELSKRKHENRSRASLRAAFMRRLDIAEDDSHEKRFYQPHQPCFRSRCYALPSLLNHQQDDIARGLLKIADAKKPTGDAERWLYIHAANQWGREGLDKKHFNTRVQWVNDNASEIERAVSDPVRYSEWWTQAKSPWQFLAACNALCDPNGAGAHIPVGADGACNALQHYAAMMLDETSARAVNMNGNDEPNDAYTPVAVETLRVVEIDAKAGLAEAIRVLNFVNRDLIKNPTMTFFYDVTVYGARLQLRNKLVDLGFEKDEALRVSRYLSRVVMAALSNSNKAARVAMDYIKSCARIIVGKGNLLGWTTDLGWPVLQASQKYQKQRRIRIVCHGMEFFTREPLQEPKPLTKAQINGSAPNYVHSQDATHMLKTAWACDQAGVWFAEVHDCFLTHAATMDEMGSIIREQFVSHYSTDQLARTREEWIMWYGVDLPPVPSKGGYDLNKLLTSPYAFC